MKRSNNKIIQKNHSKGLLRAESKGFTLIEIVIVLAIAGLIFVIVFLAVQQAQRSRRDTQRRSDISRLSAAIEQFAGSNNGDLPANQAQLNSVVNTYVGTNFVDPSTGANYNVVLNGYTGAQGNVGYYRGYKCNGSSWTYTASLREHILLYNLEAGGVTCSGSQ